MAKRAKSSREIRRAKVREDRKALMEIPLTPVERLRAQFYRNGITDADIQKAYEQGTQDGRKFAEGFAFRAIYAAFLITLIDKHGVDADAAVDMLIEIDRQTVLCVADEDLIDEAYRKTGVELRWEDAVGRITRGKGVSK